MPREVNYPLSNLRLATIGVWGHVATVLDEIGEMPGVALVASARALPDDDLQLLHRWPLASEAAGYDDYRLMLREARPDVVIVSTRLDRIAPIAMDVAAAGCHLICEKPLALDRATLRSLYEVVQANRTQCLPMLAHQAEPVLVAARRAIAAGDIGNVILANARKSYKWGERPEWFGQRALYGGTIPWIGIHALDLIHSATGLAFTQVAAMHANGAHAAYADCEDHAAVIVGLTGGAHATASIDLFRPAAAATHGDDWIRVVGSSGVLESHLSAGTCRLITATRDLHDLPIHPSPGYFAPMLKGLASDRHAWTMQTARGFMLTDAALCARDAADAGEMASIEEGPWHGALVSR